MSDDPLHADLDPLPVTSESSNGFGPHDDADTEAGADSEAAVAAESPDFLGRLADAMRQTAEAERSRVREDIDRRRDEHLAAIQARRESEAARMREMAAEDRKSIEAWAAQERQRIQKERDERLSAVEADLATSLDEHGTEVDREVERVESAIAAHRTEVDTFFASLGSESDPVKIAQLAGQRPAFPDLETAAPAEASATGTDATEPVAAGGSTSDGGDGTAEAIPVMASADEAASSESSSPAADAAPAAPEPAAGAEADAEQPVMATAANAEEEGVAVMDPIARLGLLKASDQAVETALPRAIPAGAWRPGTDDARADRPTAHAGSPSGGLNAIGWFRRRDDSGDR